MIWCPECNGMTFENCTFVDSPLPEELVTVSFGVKTEEEESNV